MNPRELFSCLEKKNKTNRQSEANYNEIMKEKIRVKDDIGTVHDKDLEVPT